MNAAKLKSQSISERLGGTPHLSPLLRKTRKMGLTSPDSLLALAVKRGCLHYTPPNFIASNVLEPGKSQLSDAELAIALISGAQEFDPQRIRCAAQLLGSPNIDSAFLARLTAMERCEPIIAHIAQAALRHDEPERIEFWKNLSSRLKSQATPAPGILPHPSRFMVQAGLTKPGHNLGAASVWLKPSPAR